MGDQPTPEGDGCGLERVRTPDAKLRGEIGAVLHGRVVGGQHGGDEHLLVCHGDAEALLANEEGEGIWELHYMLEGGARHQVADEVDGVESAGVPYVLVTL